jgi:hypothetical protein
MVNVPLKDASVTPAMVTLWPIFKPCEVVVVIVTTPVVAFRDAPPAGMIAATGDNVCVTDTFAGKAELGVIGFDTVMV